MSSTFGRAAVAASVSTALSAFSMGQTLQISKGVSLTLKGFISATAFAQDQNFAFGNGQSAEWPVPPQTTVDPGFGGGEVRKTLTSGEEAARTPGATARPFDALQLLREGR